MEKKAKETGESAADIRKKIKCHNCGKAGHISSTDCKKEKSSKPQKGKSKNKDSVVATEPAPLPPSFQPSLFASLYPLPPLASSESIWNSYYFRHSHVIDQHFRNWLTTVGDSYQADPSYTIPV